MIVWLNGNFAAGKTSTASVTWLEERWAAYDAFDPLFAEHIDTTTASARAIAGAIAAKMPQPLPSNVGVARWTAWRRHDG